MELAMEKILGKQKKGKNCLIYSTLIMYTLALKSQQKAN